VPYLAVDAEGIEEMVVKDYVRKFELTDETPIAWDSKTGKPCAYRRKFGKGHATLVGFKIQYLPSFHDFHRRFVKLLLDIDSVKMAACSENTDLLVTEKKGAGYSYLFVLNAIGLPVKSKVLFTDPSTHKRIIIPRLLDGVELKKRGGLILAVDFPLERAKATVSYTTSMIQGVEEEPGLFALTLHGQAGTRGETAIALTHKPQSFVVDGGKKVGKEWVDAEKRLYMTYEHSVVPTKLTVTF
jgi:hypothetical protein